ncbi:MAG: S1/P1 nuclease [Bryobacteraceae bacterium]|jgi:hypothetical protein
MRKMAGIAVIAGCLPTFAWGPEGHSLVARIADAQLTPAARARVVAILGPNTSMASIASWADQVRPSRPDTEPWHFIDIPIDKPHLDMARDCPKGDCVIARIEYLRKALNDPAITPAERREDLMFLIHFIGDMHQPLHCANNNDKGGNDVPVEFFGRRTNLHSVWDSGLLGRMGTENELFGPLSAESARHARKWSKGTVEDWAEQAHKAAQKMVYGRLPKVAAGAPVPIGAAYEKKADPLIREQIERAGARLAAVLNAAFD